MRSDTLSEALREAPLPISSEAEERGRRIVEAAYADRRQQRRVRAPLPRIALALLLATVLAALLLSPAGAAMRDWVDDAFTASTPRPEPTLAEIPGGGQLLVQSASGPWVVQADGSRRLLGDYEEATWSPRGLFVAVAEGPTLSAVEPNGDPRWSITAPGPVSDPRWLPSLPYDRIAYRAGRGLRVVAGDGTEDRLIDAGTAAVAPAWAPLGGTQLAYVDSGGMLRIADSESGDTLASSPALARITQLEWGGDGGSLLLETSRDSLRLRTVRAPKLARRPEVAHPDRLPVPPGAQVRDAALSPRHGTVAAVFSHPTSTGARSTVALFAEPDAKPRRLLSVPGNLGEVAWAPGGDRLLVAWPDANQWLFLPVGRGQGRAVADVSAAFAPGRQTTSFPRVEGWCCHR